MTFTEEQQQEHRAAFIKECREKAWGALCHAEWISKELDQLLAHFQKLQAEDGELEASIKDADNALDHHTVENRQKRKAMQERRNALKTQMDTIAKNAGGGQQSLQNLHQNAESNLRLAEHAETWSFKEVEAQSQEHEQHEEKQEE